MSDCEGIVAGTILYYIGEMGWAEREYIFSCSNDLPFNPPAHALL